MDSNTQTADLHVHTVFSDGTDTPQRVVELAKEAGLSAMAITDHDNVDAFELAQPVAQRLGVELLTGIEMSASVGECEVHVLGFLFDRDHGGLTAHLVQQKARRVERVREMTRRLERVGVRIDAEEVLALAKEGTVGRPHVARVLLKHGYITSLPEAFSRYLGPGNPGFVSGSPMPPARIIRVIREAGGVPVLAHPVYMKRDALIDELAADGLAGLEVYHGGHTPDLVPHYERIADRLGLLKTGGSDYHGTPKEGVAVGAMRAPYTAVESLKVWKRQHLGT